MPHRCGSSSGGSGSQLALFAAYSFHAFITGNPGAADIENAIRGVESSSSGRFAANGAWLAMQVMAHNLARWTARIGLGEQTATTKTLRRRFFSLAGRLTRSARRLTLHLPQSWPWQEKFGRALARLRAIHSQEIRPAQRTTEIPANSGTSLRPQGVILNTSPDVTFQAHLNPGLCWHRSCFQSCHSERSAAE